MLRRTGVLKLGPRLLSETSVKEESVVRAEQEQVVLVGDGDRKGSAMLSQWVLGVGQ